MVPQHRFAAQLARPLISSTQNRGMRSPRFYSGGTLTLQVVLLLSNRVKIKQHLRTLCPQVTLTDDRDSEPRAFTPFWRLGLRGREGSFGYAVFTAPLAPQLSIVQWMQLLRVCVNQRALTILMERVMGAPSSSPVSIRSFPLRLFSFRSSLGLDVAVARG